MGPVLAHRVAWELYRGPIPAGLRVLHHCDNPRCVNPDHLYLGTQRDNMRDCQQRGREPDRKGVQNGHSKLTEDQVRFIRRSALPAAKMAALLGVCRTAVGEVRRGRNWKHVDA